MLLNDIQYWFVNDWMVIKEFAIMFTPSLLDIFWSFQGGTIFWFQGNENWLLRPIELIHYLVEQSRVFAVCSKLCFFCRLEAPLVLYFAHTRLCHFLKILVCFCSFHFCLVGLICWLFGRYYCSWGALRDLWVWFILFTMEWRPEFNFNGNLSEEISINNGVKQGDISAPMLFNIYFAIVFLVAFYENSDGIYIRYRTSGNVFNVRRLLFQRKVSSSLVRELLYADDCDIVAHSEDELQCFMNHFVSACNSFSLKINLKKTVVMYDPALVSPYIEPIIFVEGNKLDVVHSFALSRQYPLWGMHPRQGNLLPHWKGVLVFFST